MEIRKILVPTDFSANAQVALDAAVELARPLGASLHLLHVIHLPVQISPIEGMSLPVAYWEGLRRFADSRLAEQKAKVVAQGIACTTESIEDIASFAISEAAKRQHSDLIVMGSRGLTGLKHFALGSVAERTVRAAECPVLTVKHAAKLSELNTILVPVDFSDPSDAALALAKSIVRRLGRGHLILAHAYYIPAELQQYVMRNDGFVQRISMGVSRELDKLVAALRAEGISAESATVEGTPERVIQDLVHSKKVDLVALGTHGRRGMSHLMLGSVAERVLRFSEVPVLTVRAKPAQS
ncbi:MAG TPA: universal stress protein [Myxococcota bacterium]|nr:universal stress protein [Myxococcota bacterium]